MMFSLLSTFLVLAFSSVSDSCLSNPVGKIGIDVGPLTRLPEFPKFSSSPCEALEIVTRDTWSDRKPTSKSSIPEPVSDVFIHHTEKPADPCFSKEWCTKTLKGIQKNHMDVRGFNDIAYSFLIGGDGVVYEGRGWNTEGAHTCGFNKDSYAICFIGNFEDELPDKLALKAAKNLIACGQKKNMIASAYALHGHRDGDVTSCPGDKLYKHISSWPAFNNKEIIAGDNDCTQVRGVCQCKDKECTGQYEDKLCSGDSRRKCCIPKTTNGLDTPCISKHGTCQDNSKSCNGEYQTGLCGGANSRQCCVPAKAGSACNKVTIIPRSTWKARSPKSTSSLQTPVDMFFIHHTDGRSCNNISSCSGVLRGIQNWHMDPRPNFTGWQDIGYSFLAGDDGNIYEGRGWDRVGAHTKGYNSKGLALSFMGNYENDLPPDVAITAAENLIECGIEKGKIASNYRLYGHRDVSTSTCPGNALYAAIQKWPHYSGTAATTLQLTQAELTTLRNQLEIDEGVEYEIYEDTLGYLTFGIGHKIIEGDPEYGKPIGTKVSRARVGEAFNSDIQTVLDDVFSWSNDCNQWPAEVKQIISNMMFNLGLTRLNKFERLKSAVQRRDWKDAADEMKDSLWATQVGDRAVRLINRMKAVTN